jgi:hypothetical protein
MVIIYNNIKQVVIIDGGYINVLLVTTDLQFKIIMSQKNQQQQSEKRSASTNSHRSRKDESRSRGAGGIDKGSRVHPFL